MRHLLLLLASLFLFAQSTAAATANAANCYNASSLVADVAALNAMTMDEYIAHKVTEGVRARAERGLVPCIQIVAPYIHDASYNFTTSQLMLSELGYNVTTIKCCPGSDNVARCAPVFTVCW